MAMMTPETMARALKQLDRLRGSSRRWANVVRIRIVLSFIVSIFTVWLGLSQAIASYKTQDPHQREDDAFMENVILSDGPVGEDLSPLEVQKIERKLAEARAEDTQQALARKGTLVDAIIGVVVLAAMITALAWAIRNHHKESASISRQKLSEQELALRSVQNLYSAVSRLSSATRLQRPFGIAIDRSRHCGFPSVRKIGDKDTLVVPEGFLGFMNKHPAASEAILAHELAHIAHGDFNLFFLSDLFIRTVMKIQFPVVCLSAAATFATWQSIAESQKTSAFNAMAAPILILAFYYSVQNIRRRSESVADLAAAIYVGSESIIEAIGHLDRPSFLFPAHEQPRQRANRIKQFARRFLPVRHA